MKKYITSISLIAIFVVAAGVVAVPTYASAATVYLEASRTTIAVGDTAIIAVKVNADGAVLNTVEGDVVLKTAGGAGTGNITVQQFSLANSVLGLWPRTPSLSQNGQDISFVGGVPGGFSIEGATLFKIIVQATKAGTITITPQNISVFANDGNGTKLPSQSKNLVITVTPQKAGVAPVNDWSNVVSTDTTPPENFIIVFGQDASLFGGKKFAYFSAVDNQSGIDHYEVSEDGSAFVRSGSTYVMQDQSSNARLVVVAYDKAGNKTSVSYPSQEQSTKGIAWLSVIIAVIVILIVYAIVKKVYITMKLKKVTK